MALLKKRKDDKKEGRLEEGELRDLVDQVMYGRVLESVNQAEGLHAVCKTSA